MSDTKIYLNIWDDSPPGAPLIIEGAPPDLDQEEILSDFLAGANTAGYRIKGNVVQHPTMAEWTGTAKDETEHFKFLDNLVKLFENRTWRGVHIVVYSES